MLRTCNKFILIALVTFTIASLIPTAQARIVFDPANYTKNTVTSIQQYLDTANSYIQTAQDLRQTARNMDTVVSEKLGLDTDELQLLKQFVKTGRNLKDAIEDVKAIKDDLDKTFVGGNKYLTWQDFIANIGDRRVHGDKQAKSLYEAAKSAQTALKQSYEKHTKIAKEMPKIAGVTDAAISTSEMVGILVEQNQAMLHTMSEGSRVKGQELQLEAIERERKELARKAYIEAAQKRSEKELEFFKNQIRK